MNAATEFDVGPLTWVKSEIDLALERADQALQQFSASVVAGSGDLTQLRFSRTHLHQVQGALTIVGLDGVTQFAEAVESLLEGIEQQKRPADENSVALAPVSYTHLDVYKRQLQSGAGVREIAAANQMVMLTQRIAKNASSLLVGDEISPEIAFLLGKDTNTFRELLNALQKGNENLRISGTTDADTKRKLGDLETSFKEYQDAVGGILGSMQRLTLAKRAGSSIFRNSEGLLESTDNLANAYQQGGRLAYGVTFAVLMFLALATLAMMAKVYLDDSRRQAETANESRQATESINRQNQDAILRLMNELGDLADGDLTVTATVSEDITGAIADSINYTIEELRVLVRRINDAAGRVTTATGIAQQTSVELLEAAQRLSLIHIFLKQATGMSERRVRA